MAVLKLASLLGGTKLPVVDTVPIVKGSVDDTKLMRFEVDGFTAGNTRVLTPPDQDFTLAGLEVGNVFTTVQSIQAPTATNNILTLKTTDDDTTNPLISIKDSAGSSLLNIDTPNNKNVFIGVREGNTIVAATHNTYNTLIGFEAGYDITTGSENVCIGGGAGTNLTTGTRNFFLGNLAGANAQSSSGNIAIGREAMGLRVLTGIGNIAIGDAAGRSVTTATNNIFIGSSTAGTGILTGNYNVGVGDMALWALTSGGLNTAIGRQSIFYNQTGSNNVGIGYRAGLGVYENSHSNNTFIGTLAGNVISTGSDNVCIGYRAGATLATESDKLIIANTDTTTPLIYGEFDNDLLKFYADNADTNVIHDVLYLIHNSSNTPAAGFGTGLLFQGESSTTPDQNMGRLAYVLATATHATRKARGIWSVYDTAEREAIRIEASGTAAMLGFYGVTAVVRPTALTSALTQITHTGPTTPDYAIATPIDSGVGSAWGFSIQDEFETTMSVILNLQTRVDELETKIQSLGLLT